MPEIRRPAMKNEKKISVIVPVYKIEKYISKCIESIVNQTYKNLEIILVDDGSPDNCGLICDEWKKNDPRIVVIHKPNGGLSDARNAGIDYATGDLLGFVDGDDYIASNFYETLTGLMEKYNQSIAECGCIRFSDGTEPQACKNQEDPDTRIIQAKEWLTETNLRDFLPYVAWNKLYDKRIFKDIKYPKGRIHEDEATTYKLVYCAGSVARTYERLYFYRERDNSITSDADISLKRIEHSLLAFKERAEYFESMGEKEISDFARAKYCIGLCGKLRLARKLYRDNDRKIKRQTRDEIKSVYSSFKNDTSVPLKYKLYISGIMLGSYFFW